MEKDLAEETSLLALKISATLDSHLRKLQQHCSPKEFEKMRQGVGFVTCYLCTDVMDPIWKMYPELRPEEMDGSYKVPPHVYLGY